MMNDRQKYDFTELVLLLMQGDINPRQIDQLELLLKTEPEAVRQYIELMEIYTELALHTNAEPAGEIEETGHYDAFLYSLAREEKTAPSVAISRPRESLPDDSVQRAPVRSESWRFNKNSLFTMIVSAAAMILVVILARYAPLRSGIEVATLTDSVHAAWVNVDFPMESGSRLVTSYTPMFLKEGVVQLLFDNNAEVLIEGPAEFQVIAADQIHLSYGMLFAKVPKEAIGFTVRCETTKVIDLGTEFGVSADLRGGVEVHVLEGKTLLFAGDHGGVTSVEVPAGAARKVTEAIVSEIPCNQHLFARRIDSTANLVWRGQTKIDLADIVGGGNGFGTGQACVGIDPATGKLSSTLIKEGRVQETYRYCPVPENPCIDGVFVPLGGKSSTVVTSRGNIFKECPDTDGGYWIEITNRPITSLQATAEGNEEFQLARLNEIQYGTPKHPAIMLHANTGITFDLNAIRSMHSGTRIRCFTSSCGLSDTLIDTSLWSEAKAVLWVLIDGQMRQMIHVDTSTQKSDFINININENDRFLTLVATDGGTTINGDWTIFGDPVLVLDQVN